MKPALLVAAVAFATAGCGDDPNQCEDYGAPVRDVAITQGVAGFGASVSDVCSGLFFVDCPCQPSDVEIDFFAVDAAPADDAAARDVVASTTPVTVSTGSTGYEQRLDAGSWLACLGELCRLIDIDDDTVTTVHAVSSADLPRLWIFAADGTELTPRGYDVRVEPVEPPAACTGLSEGECLDAPACAPGYGHTAENFCAGDFDAPVYFECFDRADNVDCGEAISCIETPLGPLFRTTTCFTAGFAPCEEQACD